MTRLGVYAAVSTALAGGVIVSAFHQRANFYSACVYLSQSNLCLMILINLILFIYSSFMYGLQRLCYGPLRPIEIEQLYEKGWFAVTETCLAMTIFREDVGAWFLVMFVALITGKVWGWIGDGRVEVLEQQPPANPRLFHIRLTVSLSMSIIYDVLLLSYTIREVIQQARPTMMVMFLFEFAVLTTASFATACRYGLSLTEAKIVKQQTQERLIERRREVREERAEMIRQREVAAAAGEELDAAQAAVPLPSEDDVDEMDIEVPGWEAKGHWVLFLDLFTDFVKLVIYTTFFFILLFFYGLPIHIMRDLFMTGRSFTKRLVAFLKYKRATSDMNAKYQDATVEDIEREDTCIICREEMRPWSVTNPVEAPIPGAPAPAPARPAGPINERSRPKKLPCGHILHLGCLKSWLERQQACPTCRRPVIDLSAPARPGPANPRDPVAPAEGVPGQPDPQPPAAAPRRPGMHMFNLGPLRFGFGQANPQMFARRNVGGQAAGLPGALNAGPGPRVYGLELGFPRRQAQPQGQENDFMNFNGSNTLQDQIRQIEQTILAEIRGLEVTQQELQLVQLLQAELARLRLLQTGAPDPPVGIFQMPQLPQLGLVGVRNHFQGTAVPNMQRFGGRPMTEGIPSGSSDLPPGVTIPEGWTLLPLQRTNASQVVQRGTSSQAGHLSNSGLAPSQSETTTTLSPTIGDSNNNLTPTPTQNPENHSTASSAHSSDTNAIHTPPSISADQSGVRSTNNTLQNVESPSNSTASSIDDNTHSNNPPALPNWGSSLLFPGSANRPANNGDVGTAVKAITRQPSTLNLERDDTLDQVASTDESASAGAVNAGELSRDKGKAKAASMEEVDDEEA